MTLPKLNNIFYGLCTLIGKHHSNKTKYGSIPIFISKKDRVFDNCCITRSMFVTHQKYENIWRIYNNI